ncbi:hypothetical protein FOH10_27365 [Nocardia otitidiscaviarum]|uniref:Uncharacterized protein n=1 Tax=Nocardia otitidiscaviarum TaxID=1823 RepID=A0A516NSQ1_9NOCA|nr:hypothetical protein [Nocardia otitidiscaviarum]MCP9621152.1 hypothetical protein [Nocardia otitidiscaviarum]QDP81904.1 hypothetical protein FOH10_27365 [Nocardia otitidiscaviarum]
MSAAAVLVVRCDVDGGLLDPGSTASRRHEEQIRSAAAAVQDREYLAAHRHDVHTDVVVFANAVCAATEAVRAAAPAPSDSPPTVEQAVAESKSGLWSLADAAALGATRVEATALPATDRVLTPGIDDETWKSLRAQVVTAFADTGGVLRELGDSVDAHRYADAATASAQLRIVGDTAETRLGALGTTVNDVLSRLPIPNSETEAALRSSGVCVFPEA